MAISYILKDNNGMFGWIFLKHKLLKNNIKNHQQTSNKLLKYGLQADRTILCALQVCPSHAKVTSVKLFSSRKCRNDDTILL